VPVEETVEDTQRRIRELEAQVELLKDKATAAGMSSWYPPQVLQEVQPGALTARC
jgi:hypothetical protein